MTFLIAHLSDPHIGPLPRIPLGALMNKRLTGTLNWHRSRATIHNMDVLDHVITDILRHRPDHVALTGDLVNVGYAPEFAQAHRHIRPLGNPKDVSIIPGNHDAYIGASLPAMLTEFGSHMRGDGAREPHFPYLRMRGNVALIGINSGVPTLPFMATGRVGASQREALAALLEKTRGCFRVVMIHHPPHKGGARFGRGLTDAGPFCHMIGEAGAELVLHGHNHRHSIHWLAGRSGAIPIIGVASASAVPGTPHHCAEYHLYRFAPEYPDRPILLERHRHDPATGAIAPTESRKLVPA